jgi:hypothetical protein
VIRVARDCPECASAGTVRGERCRLCDATVSEPPVGAADLPPAAPPASLRLSDVIEELRAIVALVSVADGAGQLVVACRRVEELLMALREQFLQEVVVARPNVRPAELSRTGR